MYRYLIRRVLSAIPLLFGLLTITFFIIRLAPGDPVSLYVQGDVDPHYAEDLRAALGLSDPLPLQYVKWLKGTLTGELGVSFSKNAEVADILLETLPNTLLLTTFALLFNFVLGIGLGIITALKRGSGIDHTVNITSLFVYSMPEFWLGLMLILGVSLQLGVLPASGMHSPLAKYLSFPEYVWDVAQHMVLPVFVLGVASAAATGRYMRGSLLEVINQDYIRTARAKGLSEVLVIGKHAMRNAMIPIITLLGLSLPFLLGGAVIVETVFAWPGMGKLTIDAIFSRDYPLIIACTMVSGVMVISGNLVADLLYALVDPRIRYD
ncbi:MAG: ABC transporter permease [Bacteroidetes bacterium]|nr:ABC transporter permease [Bacteroidota bacterium]